MKRDHLERGALIGLSLFMGPVAAACGAILAAGRSDDLLAMDQSVLQGSPFTSFTVPGIALGAVVGGAYLTAACGLLRRAHWGAAASLAAGIFLMGFEVVEVASLGWLAPKFLQPYCFVYGLVTAALAIQQMRRQIDSPFSRLRLTARHTRP